MNIECMLGEERARLDAALCEVEQTAQSIRWRVANIPDDSIALDHEVPTLMAKATQVVGVYGGLAFLRRIDAVRGVA